MNEEEAIAKALKDKSLDKDQTITVVVKNKPTGCLSVILWILFFFFLFMIVDGIWGLY